MRKFFSSILLFFISCGTAFADSGFMAGATSTPVASHTDLSIAYLSQLFGTVGHTLQGTSGQMLGMLFTKLNEGMLVVGGVSLAYTVATIAMRSAMDGSFMGGNKNVFWIVIRIAIGFAMLIPGPMTGYNVIQDIVMKIVVQGVSLADQTWNYGLNYLQEGGSLWRRPGSSGPSILSDTQANTILTGPAKSIFLNEVCMLQSSMLSPSNNNKNANTGGIVNTTTPPILYHVIANDSKGQYKFNFPGVGNGKNFASNLSSINPTVPTCGSVQWSAVPGINVSGDTQSANDGRRDIAKAATSQLVYDLLPAARKFVCESSNGNGGVMCVGINGSSITKDNQKSFFESLVNYVNLVYPIVQNQKSKAKWQKRFIPRAERDGWLTAGRYYWDLSRIQSGYEAASNIAKYIPPVKTAVPEKIKKTNILTNAASAITGYIGKSGDSYKSTSPAKQTTVYAQLAAYRTASRAGYSGTNSNTQVKAMRGVKIGEAAATVVLWSTPLILLKPIVVDMGGLYALFTTNEGGLSMGTDPILFLHRVGMHCLNIAADIWLGLALAIFGLAMMTTICQATLNLSTPLSMVTGWIKPGLMAIAAALMGTGIMLGYYLPMYPFMLFTFGVIGWMISVIEAMVAAPLIAFGLTHPEGHDFLGEAKQAMMLLLGLFLRPVLMVIGLIAGMILSYVSLRILVYTYGGFTQDLFYNYMPTATNPGSVVTGAWAAEGNMILNQGGSFTGIIMSLAVFPIILGIFASLVYVVTNQCFSLIFVLPDYVMRWLGVSSPGSSSASMAQQTKGGFSQLGSSMGTASSQGSAGGSQAGHAGIKNLKDSLAEKDKLKKANEINHES